LAGLSDQSTDQQIIKSTNWTWSMSPEEFFMYLTIGLIVMAPIGARIYRRLTLRRTEAMLREQFGHPPVGNDPPSSKR
jgi:hypothetical protein